MSNSKLPADVIQDIENAAKLYAEYGQLGPVSMKEAKYLIHKGASTEWSEKWWEVKQENEKLKTRVKSLEDERDCLESNEVREQEVREVLIQENERLKAALEEMNESAQRLFDVRKQKNKGNIVLNAWNDLAGMLYKSKRLLKALAEKVKEGEE